MNEEMARAVFSHLKIRMTRFRRAYSHVPFNAHDWDDVTQIIMIHIAKKWHMWRGGTWKKWVNVISRNQFKNYCLFRLTETNRKGPHQPLYTKLVEDENGNEVAVYEPDMIDESVDSLTLIYRALDMVPKKHQRLFDRMLKTGSWESARGKMKPSRFQTYRSRQCQIVRDLVSEMS